jgi:hypothetical protein
VMLLVWVVSVVALAAIGGWLLSDMLNLLS